MVNIFLLGTSSSSGNAICRIKITLQVRLPCYFVPSAVEQIEYLVSVAVLGCLFFPIIQLLFVPFYNLKNLGYVHASETSVDAAKGNYLFYLGHKNQC